MFDDIKRDCFIYFLNIIILRTLQVGTDIFVPSGITKQAFKNGRVIAKNMRISNNLKKKIIKYDSTRLLSSKLQDDVLEQLSRFKKQFKNVKNRNLKGKTKRKYREFKEFEKAVRKNDIDSITTMMSKRVREGKLIKESIIKEKPSYLDNMKYVGKSIVEHATPYLFRGTRQKTSLGILKDYKSFQELDTTEQILNYRFNENNSIQANEMLSPKTSFIKYAKISRNDNQQILKKEGIVNNNLLNDMHNIIDELSIKIFRQLKNDLSLEYARVGI